VSVQSSANYKYKIKLATFLRHSVQAGPRWHTWGDMAELGAVRFTIKRVVRSIVVLIRFHQLHAVSSTYTASTFVR